MLLRSCLICPDRTSCVPALGQVCQCQLSSPSQLASAPAAATPASVRFLTRRGDASIERIFLFFFLFVTFMTIFFLLFFIFGVNFAG